LKLDVRVLSIHNDLKNSVNLKEMTWIWIWIWIQIHFFQCGSRIRIQIQIQVISLRFT